MTGEQVGQSGTPMVRSGGPGIRSTDRRRAACGLALLITLVLPLVGCAESRVPQPFGPEQASGCLTLLGEG